MSTEKLNCLVVDDEPHATEILEMYIQKTPFLHMVNAETDPWKAIEYLKSNKVEILFLDIQMEGLSGLQVMDLLQEKPAVILTTAYEQYALKGFEYKVSDYLLKPFSYDRFLKAVNHVKENQMSNSPTESIVSTPSKSDTLTSSPTHFMIKGDAKNKFHRIKFSDIQYIEGLKNYVKFQCSDQSITALYSMTSLMDLLPENSFIRVHKSFIINLDHVNMVEGNLIKIGSSQIPIGASFKKSFLDRIKS